MNAKLPLTGEYSVQGKKLFSTEKSFYLILDERVNKSKHKPPQFIVAKCPDCQFTETGKPDQYISSVYLNGRIEYGGNNYTLTIDGEKAVISQSAMNKKGTLYL